MIDPESPLAWASRLTANPPHGAGEEMMEISPDEMMAMMVEAATPGDNHAGLTALVGNWDVEYEHWMEPGSPPSKATATSTYRSILGGRYVLEEFHSEFDGAPFEGMLILGYDNVRQQFQSLWIDNFSTGFHIQRGQMDESGTKRLRGKAFDLMTPKGRPVRSEVQLLSDDHFTMQMFDGEPGGPEWVSMSFEYKRAAD